MEILDPAGEWRRLSERYRQMGDNELLALAQQSSQLTDVAQQALASEVSRRRLKAQPVEPPSAPTPEPPDSPYAEDRALIEICKVWSLTDALQLQTLLDRAGIPFFMGPEKATGVDTVTSNFAQGVSVQIMRIGLPWARQTMRDYTPADQPDPKQEEELPDVTVRCPRCDSTEVVLEHLTPEPPADNSSPQYEWTCDACGHHWNDDGVVKEV